MRPERLLKLLRHVFRVVYVESAKVLSNDAADLLVLVLGLLYQKGKELVDEGLQAFRIVLDDLPQGVQEQILFMMFGSIYQLEDFLQEEIGVSNRYVTQANRCGSSNGFILDLELVLNSIHYVCN